MNWRRSFATCSSHHDVLPKYIGVKLSWTVPSVIVSQNRSFSTSGCSLGSFDHSSVTAMNKSYFSRHWATENKGYQEYQLPLSWFCLFTRFHSSFNLTLPKEEKAFILQPSLLTGFRLPPFLHPHDCAVQAFPLFSSPPLPTQCPQQVHSLRSIPTKHNNFRNTLLDYKSHSCFRLVSFPPFPGVFSDAQKRQYTMVWKKWALKPVWAELLFD
jgi:hypothetical protein